MPKRTRDATERDVIAGVDAAGMALPRRASNQTRIVVEAGTTSLIIMRRTSKASIEHPTQQTPQNQTQPIRPRNQARHALAWGARVGAQYAYDMLSRPKRTESHTVAVHRRIRPHVHEPLEIPQQGYT